MKPYKFKAIFKETLWGGTSLAAWKKVETQQKTIGESWEISAVPGEISVVAERGIKDDADCGKTLTQLIEDYREALVGAEVYRQFGTEFPLLVKFIDAQQNLSVQVHPNDALAQQRHQSRGKTEMWYVLSAEPRAKIYAGLRTELTPARYEELMRTPGGGQQVAAALAVHEVHPGDVFFLPAGRLHAIGAGVVLAEIQQTSNITYRVYDFDRVDAQGRPRELHIAAARDAIDYRVFPEYRTAYDATQDVCELVTCPHFTVWRVMLKGARRVDFHRDSFVVVICLSGAAQVNGVSVRAGESLLVPAAANVMDLSGEGSFLMATM